MSDAPDAPKPPRPFERFHLAQVRLAAFAAATSLCGELAPLARRMAVADDLAAWSLQQDAWWAGPPRMPVSDDCV